MDSEKSLTRRILKGSIITIFFTSFTPPIAYLIKMLYSRNLSIEHFGLFYAILTFIWSISSYTDLGFGYSLTYLVPKYLKKRDYQSCWNLYKYNQLISLITSTLLSITIIAFAKQFSKYYFKMDEAQTILFIFTIYLIGNSLLSSLERFFTGLQQEKYYSSIQSVRTFLTFSFSIAVWLINKSNILYFAVCWAIGTVIATFVYSTIMHQKNKNLINKITWNKNLFRSMFRYALPSLLTTSIYIFISSEVIFLTLLKGVRAVGIYTVILPLATMSSIVLSPINTFLFPLISHLIESEKEKVMQLISSALKIIPFISFYFALFIILFPEQPIQILFGQKWVAIAKTPLIILSIGYIGYQVSNFLATVVIGIGEVNSRFRASLVLAIIDVTLAFLLISKYSIIGATVSSSIVFFLSIILNTLIIKKIITFKFPIVFYTKLTIFGITILALNKIINFHPIGLIDYLITGFLYTLIFIGFGYSLKLFNKDMIKSLQN